MLFMEDYKIKSIIESLLLASGDPLELKKISKIIKEPLEKIEKNVEALIEKYNQENGGLQIIEQNQRIQLVSNPDNFVYLKKLIKVDTESQLTSAAQETLAIVAYRGPLSRAEIDLIRGVNSSFILRNLMVRGLVERVSRKNKIRGYLYQVTLGFLKQMGISKIEDLPDYEKLRKNKKVKNILKFKNKEE